VFGSLAGSFKDQASEMEGQGERVADQHGFGGVGQPKGGGTFEVSASLGGIAALGIGLPADTQLPGIGTDLQVTRQADGAIGQGERGGQGEPQGMGKIGEGAGGVRDCGGSGDVGITLVGAFETADPFGGMALVVMAIAGQVVAVWAKRGSVLVIATLQTGERVIIAFGVAQTNGAQGLQILVDKLQDLIVAFACIAQQFANLEARKALVQISEAGEGQQVIVAVGWGGGTGQWPDQEEPVIDDIEGFGFVPRTGHYTPYGALYPK
jgi:hypothetical protein